MHILPQLKSNTSHDLPSFHHLHLGRASLSLCGPSVPCTVARPPHNRFFLLSSAQGLSQGKDPGPAHSPPMRPCKACPGPSSRSFHPFSIHSLPLLDHKGPLTVLQPPELPSTKVESPLPSGLLLFFQHLLTCRSCPFLSLLLHTAHTSSHRQEPHKGRSGI